MKKIIEGIEFHKDTPEHICQTILRAIRERRRVKIKYKEGFEDFTGYTKDGLNVSMWIGRSTGTVKVPLHIPRRDSIGGPALSDHLIESIKLKY